MYKLYALLHPKTKKVCYIGQTKNDLKIRLGRHNAPKLSNESIVAKAIRKYKPLGFKYSIILLAEKDTKEEIDLLEIKVIKEYRDAGIELYNIQDGGVINNTLANYFSKRKYIRTREKNLKSGKYIQPKGSDANNSILTESEIIQIYDLIKLGYSNTEIMDILSLKVVSTALSSIRNGKNWHHLWETYFTKPIRSMKTDKNRQGLTSQEKLKIVKLLEDGVCHIALSKEYGIQSGDLLRVKQGKLWVTVWNFLHDSRACIK